MSLLSHSPEHYSEMGRLVAQAGSSREDIALSIRQIADGRPESNEHTGQTRKRIDAPDGIYKKRTDHRGQKRIARRI